MSNKIIWYVVAAVAIAIPIVPDKYKIGINITQSPITKNESKKSDIITASCTLVKESQTPQGMHVCQYKCEGSTAFLYKTSMTNNYVCEKNIKERIRPVR